MNDKSVLLLSGRQVADLLTIEECIVAVEDAFRRYGLGLLPDPSVLGVHVEGGGFHIKAAVLGCPTPAGSAGVGSGRLFFAAKTNANFPGNPKRFGTPTIQGIVLLFDASNGTPLAVMDSMELTLQRTAAATGVAAKYLARADASRLALCGCGAQAAAQLRAICAVLPIRECVVFDVDADKALRFSRSAGSAALAVQVAATAREALETADVCVTCTPSRSAFVTPEMVRPGTFIAAVGADNPEKQEIAPELMRRSKVVVDVLEQCATIGDLHHAIAAGVMRREDVHAELGAIVAGRSPGREKEDEIIIFDSTGTALQDAAAACAVYRKSAGSDVGKYDFGG